MSKNNADNLMIVGIIFFTSKVHHPPALNELHRLQIHFSLATLGLLFVFVLNPLSKIHPPIPLRGLFSHPPDGGVGSR